MSQLASLEQRLHALHASGTDFAVAWPEAVSSLRKSSAPVEERLQTRALAEQIWAEEAPLPIWFPGDDTQQRTNIAEFMRVHQLASWQALLDWSTQSPGEFWEAVVQGLEIRFESAPTCTLELANGSHQPVWLSASSFNIAVSCFQADEQQTAIVFGDAQGNLVTQTYGELRRAANRVASGLLAMGLQPGSRVAILMPMIPESVAIYLGIILAGCTAVSIADSFAAAEIRRRLHIAEAEAMICLSRFQRGAKQIDLYARVVEANCPRAVVLGDFDHVNLRDGDINWSLFLGSDTFEPRMSGPDHPVNILFSSGTTGDPKAIVWDQTTPIKAAADGWFHQDIKAGDVVVWPTNLGWMMGPWLIFASLLNRATIGLYGEAPSGLGFGQFVQAARVTMLGLVPTLVRGWRASKCMEALDWSSIRCFSSTGEASNAEDMTYLSALAGFKPIIEYCGGTEIGGGYITSTMVQPNIPAAFSTPAIGHRLVILDDSDGRSDQGQLYLVPPCIGLSRRLLNRDHFATYYDGCPQVDEFPQLRRHGDYFTQLPSGYYVAGGRADDTMNLGGIKISSAEIETVLSSIPGVVETAAIGAPQAGGGPDQLIVYVVATDAADAGRLKRLMNRQLKSELNPLFRVSQVVVVEALPRTASNKIMRRELRSRFESERARDETE